ncbi:MarR family transcriptional regulator [Sphingomonas histidinilytica]|jgi:DNA-binding MarR family transcriptional regulator|uniref:DNA-binding transcriptional regulator, MarR family n=1 Tax=Rhizorhabdus histidinilytica TaxID=439228 RepID=A0A1T5AYP2_9SPHN|nr:MarR family winged helix-turn-helix transcriptional regulator [Rhizorhabdus histidinilytica]MBO9377761.1 MarR family transcriptional regulator [Rhizorhabdus histidinilytica]QEH79526.1 winged helix-turn-helix transcriptional regulator [Sphingomonas sp. C8-2]SKB40105.1 DNA-binding transcriptional regulator, MarR family [Rhizorhabdus histidinilytica]
MSQKGLILDRFIPYRLSVTSNVVSDVISTAYEALFGLSIPEWRIVAVVAEQDGITQQGVCIATRMDKVTVSRATIALVDRGLITRAPNRADRRSRLLALSEAGRRLYADVAPKAIEFEERIFSIFPADELDRFMTMLRAIEERALEVGTL